MRKRPLALFVCALLFLYFPTEFGWRWARGYPLQFGDFLFSIIFPFILTIGLVKVTKVGWYTLIAFGTLWGFKDLYELYASEGTSLTLLLVHLAIYLISLTYFINPRIRPLYFDPKLRWWRSKRRSETHLPIIVRHDRVWDYPIMRNISVGGCFVETPHILKMEELVEVSIPLPAPMDVSVIKASGEVRWTSDRGPRFGMGLEFKGLSPLHAKALRRFVRTSV